MFHECRNERGKEHTFCCCYTTTCCQHVTHVQLTNRPARALVLFCFPMPWLLFCLFSMYFRSAWDPLCSSGSPGIQNPPASASCVLGRQVYTFTPGFCLLVSSMIEMEYQNIEAYLYMFMFLLVSLSVFPPYILKL